MPAEGRGGDARVHTGKMPVLRCGFNSTAGSRRSLKHQFTHIFHGRTAVRDYLVVVFFEIELIAEFFLGGSA